MLGFLFCIKIDRDVVKLSKSIRGRSHVKKRKDE
nr:MAG TPA: hypothetical protein [Caudoviricetes sp.]